MSWERVAWQRPITVLGIIAWTYNRRRTWMLEQRTPSKAESRTWRLIYFQCCPGYHVPHTQRKHNAIIQLPCCFLHSASLFRCSAKKIELSSLSFSSTSSRALLTPNALCKISSWSLSSVSWELSPPWTGLRPLSSLISIAFEDSKRDRFAVATGLEELGLFTPSWKKDFRVYDQLISWAFLYLLFGSFPNVSCSGRGGKDLGRGIFQGQGDRTMIGAHNLILAIEHRRRGTSLRMSLEMTSFIAGSFA